MTRYTTSGTKTTIGALNTELEKIAESFVDCLVRSGEDPNTMLSDLDMNSNRILNLPAPVLSTDPLRLGDLSNGTVTIRAVDITLDTVDTLINNTNELEVGDVVLCYGYASAEDGGGAKWIKTSTTGEPASQTPAERGAAELTDADGNLFRLADDEFKSMKKLGATGQGSQGNDQLVWAACMNGGGLVLVEEGTYILRRQSVPSNTHIRGKGLRENIILQHPAIDLAGGSSSILEIEGVSGSPLENIRIEGISFDGNKSNITNPEPNNCEAINFQYVTNCHVYDVYGFDIVSELVDWDDAEDCTAEKIYGVDCGGYCVHISENSVNTYTKNSVALRCGLDNNRAGFDCFGSSSDCGIENCISKDCYIGVNVTGDRCQVSNVYVYNAQNTGVNIVGSDCVISGAIVNGAGLDAASPSPAGMIIDGQDNVVADFSIQGVQTGQNLFIRGMHSSIDNGILADNNADSINFTSATQSNVLSNILCSATGTIRVSGDYNRLDNIIARNSSNDAFTVSGDYNILSNCLAESNGDDGYSITGNYNTFNVCESETSGATGFRVNSGATENLFLGCAVFNPTTVFLVDDGTDTQITGGKGRMGEVRTGTYVSSGGGANFNIPHGLGAFGTPTKVSVVAASEDASGPYYISGVGGVNINVVFATNTPSGTDNIEFRWMAGFD